MDLDLFLLTLYVTIDDLCKMHLPSEAPRGPGRPPSLTRSEVLTLAMLSQWYRWRSERDFYRYATKHLRSAFPTLPHRAQFNRLVRQHWLDLVAIFHQVVERLRSPAWDYEALDGTPVPTRNVKRRGRGWLAGQADIGWSNRLGWYHGVHLLVASSPSGVPTGYGLAAASCKEQTMAGTFLAARWQPHPGLPMVGRAADGPYFADTGFDGRDRQRHWRQEYGATVYSRPQWHAKQQWPKWVRRQVASLRQIVETTSSILNRYLSLDRERPHALDGLQARVAARMAMFVVGCWLNQQLGRPVLAFADLLGW